MTLPRRTTAALLLALAARPALAESSWVCGAMSDVTSVSSGLLVRIGSPAAVVPDNCVASPGNWMLVPSTAQTMVAVTLSYWLAGKKDFCVYTSATTNNFCAVTQVDPAQ